MALLLLIWALGQGWVSCTTAQAAHLPPAVKLAAVQSLVINNGSAIRTLDPHKSNGAPEAQVMRDLLEGLVIFDSQGKMVPGVAIRWQPSDDFKQWLFYLRPEAKWSTGDPVTAQDFVYSWRRLADPKTHSPKASYLNDLQLLNSEAIINGEKPPEDLGIRALDKHTLQLQLSQPLPFLVSMLAASALHPLHRPTVEHYTKSFGSKAERAVNRFIGNGAYILKEWGINERLVLIRNPHYWDNIHTVIEQVTYLAVTDEIRAIQQYQEGKIEISHYLFPAENYRALRQAVPDEMWCFSDQLVSGYLFNTQRVPFNDLRVRQALALVIDYEALAREYLAQGEHIAFTLNPPNMQGIKATRPEWASWPMPRRIAKAKQLLRAVGYHQQYPLRFTLLYNTSEHHRQLALFVSGRWQQTLGAEITLECQEWTAYLDSCRQGKYQAARFGFRAEYPHPTSLLNLLRSNSSFNNMLYKNPLFDHWLQRALQATTVAERGHCYQQAEQLLVQEVPLLPLFHGAKNLLVKPYVGGLSTGPVPAPIYTKDLYLIQPPQVPTRHRQ